MAATVADRPATGRLRPSPVAAFWAGSLAPLRAQLDHQRGRRGLRRTLGNPAVLAALRHALAAAAAVPGPLVVAVSPERVRVRPVAAAFGDLGGTGAPDDSADPGVPRVRPSGPGWTGRDGQWQRPLEPVPAAGSPEAAGYVPPANVVTVGLDARDHASAVWLDLARSPGAVVVTGPRAASHELCCALAVQLAAGAGAAGSDRSRGATVAWAGQALPGWDEWEAGDVLDAFASSAVPPTPVLVVSPPASVELARLAGVRRRLEEVRRRHPDLLVVSTVDVTGPAWRFTVDTRHRVSCPEIGVQALAAAVAESLAAVLPVPRTPAGRPADAGAADLAAASATASVAASATASVAGSAAEPGTGSETAVPAWLAPTPDAVLGRPAAPEAQQAAPAEPDRVAPAPATAAPAATASAATASAATASAATASAAALPAATASAAALPAAAARPPAAPAAAAAARPAAAQVPAASTAATVGRLLAAAGEPQAAARAWPAVRAAFEALPVRRGMVTWEPPSDQVRLADLQPGQTVRPPGVVVAAPGSPAPDRSGDVALVWSVAGRLVGADLTGAPADRVAFAPGTRFAVLRAEQAAGGGARVWLRETDDVDGAA